MVVSTEAVPHRTSDLSALEDAEITVTGFAGSASEMLALLSMANDAAETIVEKGAVVIQVEVLDDNRVDLVARLYASG